MGQSLNVDQTICLFASPWIKSFQSPGRVSVNFVFQLSVDKPEGSGVVFRPWEKPSTNIPKEAAANAFEKGPTLNNV